MTDKRSSLGKKGEDLAKRHLEKLGYKVLARNYRVRLGEIDIVAEDSGTLVFVEVKTRSEMTHGGPLEAITPAKRMQLSKVALEYMGRHGRHDCPARFDVVAILLSPGRAVEIEVLQNAFESCYGV